VKEAEADERQQKPLLQIARCRSRILSNWKHPRLYEVTLVFVLVMIYRKYSLVLPESEMMMVRCSTM
jgi:hypothetical protein